MDIRSALTAPAKCGARWIARTCLLCLVASAGAAVADETFNSVLDEKTGLRLELPAEIVARPKDTKHGTNWSSGDGTISIDTLKITKKLQELYQSLRSVKSRKLTRDEYSNKQFVLAGEDRDGSRFHVEARAAGEVVVGVSVVYAARRALAANAIIARVEATFAPRQARASPMDTAALTVEGPQLTQRSSHAPTPAGAVPSNDVESRAHALDEAGRYEEALPLANQLLSDAEKSGEQGLALGTALNTIGRLHYLAGDYAEAERQLKRALDLVRNKKVDDPATIAAIHTNLGRMYLERKRYAEAVLHLRQAVRLCESTLSDKDVRLRTVLNDLAAAYEASGDSAAAAPLYARLSMTQEAAEASERSAALAAREARTRKPVTRNADTDGTNVDYQVVPVYYGTDRLLVPGATGVDIYSTDRGRQLRLGEALVTVPREHVHANIERAWTLTLPYFNLRLYSDEDPKRHFTVQEVKDLSRAEFMELVRKRIAASKDFKKHAIVFVHGYNTTFDAALFRMAQIAYDLGFDGAPFVYSWPSGGSVFSYTFDRESAAQSQRYMRDFLNLIVNETGAEAVSIVAHSMGNQPLLEVLKEMNASKPDKVAINQVILAAPDVDADRFADLAQSIKGFARGITLYAAGNDRAMALARNFWSNRRAGDVSADGPLVLPGLDSIDITAVGVDALALNHSGYAESDSLLKDIGTLIRTGTRPPKVRTPEYEIVNGASGEYWRYPSDTRRIAQP